VTGVQTCALPIYLSEGTTENLVLEDVLTDGVRFDASSVAVTAGAGFTGAAPTPTVTSGSGTVEFDFGDVVVEGVVDSGAGTGIDTGVLILTYSTIVTNDLVSTPPDTYLQDGDALPNTVTATADGLTDATDDATVTVVEPDLEIVKDVLSATANIEAGDTVTYEIAVFHTSDSSADAFDLSLTDTLPGELEGYTLVSAEIDDSVTVDYVRTDFSISAGGVLSTTGDVDLAQGEVLILTISGTVVSTTTVGDTIANSATVTWTSQNGASADEREGSGTGPNDYTDTDSAPLVEVVGFLDIDKAITNPTGGEVTIGETISYSLTVTLAEGTTENLLILDELADGVEYVSGSAVVTPGDFTLVDPLPLNPSYNTTDNELSFAFTSAVLDTNNDSTIAGTTDTGTFTITYDVLVLDDVANVDSVDLPNTVTASATGVTDATDTENISIVEPDIEVLKAVTSDASNLEAGDTVTYEITVRHSATSTLDAFDLEVSDVLPTELENLTLDSAEISNGTTTDVSGSFPISSGELTTAVGGIDLAEDETLTLVISGTVVATTTVGDTIDNTVEVTWTTKDGVDADERSYTESADAPQLSVVGFLDIDKAITNPIGGEVTIGEEISYELTVTLAEGTTNTIEIVDVLDPGVEYVAGSASVTAGNFTLNGFTVDYDDLNDELTFDFSSAVLATSITDSEPTGTIDTDTFTITYRTLVKNEGQNQSGDTLPNTVTVSATGLTDATDNETITIVEPDLAVSKDVTSNTANLEAGDTVTYEIVVNHTGGSTADAFDLDLNDNLPAELENYTRTANINGRDVSGSFDITAGVLSTTRDVDLLEGEILTLRISGTVVSATTGGDTIDNEVELTWTGVDGVVTGERDGSGGLINNYSDSDTALQLTVEGTLDIDKVVTPPEDGVVTIGETVNYTLTVTVAEGTTEGLVVTDLLPAGLSYAGNLVVTGGAEFTALDATPTVTQGSGAMGATTVEFDFGDVVVSGVTDSESSGVLDTTTFTITYDVLVDDVASNESGDLLTNTATADSDNQPPATDPETVELVEPELNITKKVTSNTAEIEAGDTVTYEIVVSHTMGSTADAFDLDLSDNLPAELEGYMLAADIDGADARSSFDITGGVLSTTSGAVDLLQGQTLTLMITGTVVSTTTVGDTIDNSVDLTWTSLDGTVSGEREYTDDATALPVIVVGFLDIDKAITDPTGGEVTIGEEISYELTVTLAEGTTNTIEIVDVLDPGVEYVAGSVVVSNGNFTLSAEVVTYDDASDTLTIEIASAVLDTNNDSESAGAIDTDTFTITYRTLVKDEVQNQNGDTLPNTVTVSANGLTDATDNETITIVEPDLTVTKVVDDIDNEVTLGQTVTYTITVEHTGASTATAFDFILEDAVPLQLVNVRVDSVTTTGTVTGLSDSLAGNTITVEANSIEVGATIELVFSAEIGPLTVPFPTIDNNARVYWDSIGDGDGNTVLGTGVAGGDRDYGATPGYTEDPTPMPDDPAQDTEQVVLGGQSIGDLVWRDQNKNGIQEPRERGIEGVVIFVDLDRDGLQGALEPFAITDEDGLYEIIGIAPGFDYSVRVDPDTLPRGLREVFVFDDPILVSTPMPGDNQTDVFILSGSDELRADFGYFRPPDPPEPITPEPPDRPTPSSRTILPTPFTPAPVFITETSSGLESISEPGQEFSALDTYFINTFNPILGGGFLPSDPLLPFEFTAGFPMLSGAAEPGSNLVLYFYDTSGQLVYSNTILVGSGGNWTASFPDGEFGSGVTVVARVQAQDFTPFSSDNNFNYRTNYVTGMQNAFVTRALTVDGVFSDSASERLPALILSEEEITSGGWNKSNYEFLAAPAIPSS